MRQRSQKLNNLMPRNFTTILFNAKNLSSHLNSISSTWNGEYCDYDNKSGFKEKIL